MAETEGAALLALRGLAKRFGDTIALAHVDLDVAPGEVHVICGENGAGKSTLMNILAGIHRPDAGSLRFDGAPAAFATPLEAGRAGIGMVHQHFKLVASMSVAENVFLGRQPRRLGLFTDRRAMRDQAAAVIARYRFDLDPEISVARLSVGQRQRVEILKALAFDARLLILDEPTAVLTPPEVSELLAVIEGLKARGRTVLFITHKLKEAMAVADHITVLRHGRTISTRPAGDVSEATVARDMVGRDIGPLPRRTRKPDGPADPALRLCGLTMTTPSGRRLLDDMSLEVAAGEIVGVAGVDGNGQTELAEAVAGVRPVQAGRLWVGGTCLDALGPGGRRDAGLGFIPEDRLDRGLCVTMTVAENVSAGNYRTQALAGRGGFIRMAARRGFAAAKIRQFDIRGAAPGLPVGQLSGGNMQKVVIARELERRPAALVVAQPSRGLDIGATEFVHRQILAAADRGCAVLLVSSELSEILALSDRIAVIHRGRLMRVLDRAEATEEGIGLLMSGSDLGATG